MNQHINQQKWNYHDIRTWQFVSEEFAKENPLITRYIASWVCKNCRDSMLLELGMMHFGIFCYWII
jgi:hypothetical protein